jgi:hypothetical protein
VPVAALQVTTISPAKVFESAASKEEVGLWASTKQN